MKVKIQSIHFDADTLLLNFIQEKLNKLDRFYDKIIAGEVFLRLDKGQQSKVKNKLLEVKISLPGAILFVKETARTFEEAVDKAIESLKGQIKRFKDKKTVRSNAILTQEIDLE